MNNFAIALHTEIGRMVQEGEMDADKHISIKDLTKRLDASLNMNLTIHTVLNGARDLGYLIHRLGSGSAISLYKTSEQIEALKFNWAKDPCWDIEDTDGFEAYAKDLEAWRIERSAMKEAEVKEREGARVSVVREQTGVLDIDIASGLCTWMEIESQVKRAISDYSGIDLAAAQVRATLLQAAQLKRIADALEGNEVNISMSDISESVHIFGTGE